MTNNLGSPVEQSQPMLLSRVASSCYWLSRYRERAEFTARVVDVHLITLLDTYSGDDYSDWLPIITINGCLPLFEQGASLTKELVLDCLVLNPANANSIATCIRNARENSRQAREQISSEMWEQINAMYHDVHTLTPRALLTDVHAVLQAVKNGSLLMQGIVDQTMMHGEAWQFIRLGRYVERANTTCRLLAVRSDPAFSGDQLYREAVHWIGVLKSVSSLEAYHKTYAAPVSTECALEFLLLNAESPRSVFYCLEHALDALKYIAGSTGRRFNSESDRLLGQMASRLHYLRLGDVNLPAVLAELQAGLYEVSNLVMQTYCEYELA